MIRWTILSLLLASVAAQDPTIGPCTVCALGTDPATDNPECSGLDAGVFGLSGTETTCLNQQLVNYQKRCCTSPPYGYCTICPDGSTPSGLQNPVPTGEFAQDPTCDEFQYQKNSMQHLFVEGDCSDTYLQRTSFYCGCPGVEQQCWLCPDKSPPGNPDRGDAWATQSNCRGLEFLFSVFRADECANIPANFGIDFAAFCLCPGVEVNQTETPVCSLCPDGGSVTNPDTVYTDEGAVFERTCRQAEEFAQYIIWDKACDRLFEQARSICTCSSAFRLAASSGVAFVAASVMTLFGVWAS
jgi:hypothetical protein